MLGADHFDGRSVLVELIESGLVQPTGFDERCVDHQCVVRRGDDESVEVGTRFPVKDAARDPLRLRSWDSVEVRRVQGPVGGSQVQDVPVERGE